MKRTILRKALSLLLVLVMLVPLTSPAFAAEELEESTLKSDAPMSLGSGNGAAMWVGEKLAGGVVSSIAGYPMNQAMGKIFGTQTDQVLQVLEEVKRGIQNIRADIADMSAKIDRAELRSVLNGYGDYINEYISVYNVLLSMKDETDPVATKEFFTGLFSCTGEYENYKVANKTLINATTALGNRLMDVKDTEGGKCNIFGAIDLYDRYTNVWEHQGYDMRQDFRNKQLGIYTLFSTMSQLACQTILDNTPGNKNAIKWAKELRDNAALVHEMVKRTSVIRHPNLRIARNIKQGIDLFAFYPDINVGYVTKNAWGDEAAWAEFSRSADRYTSAYYIYSLTHDDTPRRTAWSQGWEVYTNQPTPDEYKILLDNYNGKKTLEQIFFDGNEGNFNNVGGRSNLAFLCNHYVARNRIDGHGNKFITWESNNHVGNNGEVYGWWEFSSAWDNTDKGGGVSAGRFDHSNAFIVNKYVGEVKQGSLQGPPPRSRIEYEDLITGMEYDYELPYTGGTITLMVNKTGDEYQWVVNKNDDKGFVELENETNVSYIIPALDADMNGWQYSCTVIEKHDPETLPPDPNDPSNTPIIKDNNVYTYALPVTLNLTGLGISPFSTEHEVSSAAELKDALEKVDSGEWDQHTLKLTADISYANPISLDGMHNLTIDLNGYTLTVQPGHDAAPNVNAMSNNPQIAAICLNQDQLTIEDSSNASGKLNIVAGQGIDYGIYAANESEFNGYDAVEEGVVNVTSTGGGTAIHADGSGVYVNGSVQADGDNAYGIECLNSGSSVIVDKDVTVTGKSACGAYVASFDGGNSSQVLRILGDLTISGENSRAALLDANGELTVKGSVTVTGGREGINVNNGYAELWGNITAPNYAINARSNSARVSVVGNVSVTRENAVAVSSVGAEISVGGNVTSPNSGGVGILAATWTSPDDGSEHGGLVTAEGNISAVTPLLIESTTVTDENEKTGTDYSYNVFTIPAKGTSAVKAMPGAFEVKTTALVTFDKNGGDTEASPNTKAVITGGKAGILPATPERSDYAFAGWNTKADGSGDAFTADTLVAEAITVYAQWEYSLVNATISPASVNYDLSSPGDVCSTITWNSASTVTDVVYGKITLTTPAAYVVTGSALTIKSSYLAEQGFSEGNTAEFTVVFDRGDSSKIIVNIVNNYVPANDANLSDLKIGGSTVSGFDPNVFAYSVDLPYDTQPGSQAATVSAAVYDTKAVASITQAISLPGSAAVKVTAEDKTTTRTYTVNFTLEQAPTTYTITVQTDGNGTANANISSSSQGTQITLTANANNGYRFKEWQVIDGGVTISGNKFNMPAANVTVKAIFEYKSGGGSGSGGGSSIPTTATVPAANGSVQVNYAASNGTASLSLPTVKVNEIIEKSKSNEAVLDLSKVSGITSASIPKDALTAFAKASLDTTVKLPVGIITLDENAADSVARQANGSNVAIELKQAATGSLSDAQKETVKSGDIVLDINITSGTKKISTFDGTLTVSMPYTGPQPVAVWYLNDKGELDKLSCTFKNSVISFNLEHLSLYVVGQDTAKPAWVNPFTDVKETDWFYEAVNFCAEKGITNGTSATTFSPNATLTRGQFITMLLKAYGIEPISSPADNFSDAGSTYYTGYLAAAKARGISNGVGNNNFAPEKAITRQEMFTLLYNALKVLNKLPTTVTGKTLADFTDSGSVASWAIEAMTALVKSGTVSGSGGKLDPMGGSTRAQMVQALYNLLGK